MAVPTSIRLDAETLAQVDAIAVAEGRSRHWVLLQAVKDALEARAAYVAAVQKGLDEANAGQFAADEDVAAAFAKYGA